MGCSCRSATGKDIDRRLPLIPARAANVTGHVGGLGRPAGAGPAVVAGSGYLLTTTSPALSTFQTRLVPGRYGR